MSERGTTQVESQVVDLNEIPGTQPRAATGDGRFGPWYVDGKGGF